MPPDERVVELARLWWRKARDDLELATRATDLPFGCCFHCQQAVEKGVSDRRLAARLGSPRLPAVLAAQPLRAGGVHLPTNGELPQ